jgi:serine-type D-Ala-D-Ala carboxypeptidase/endopeptidase
LTETPQWLKVALGHRIALRGRFELLMFGWGRELRLARLCAGTGIGFGLALLNPSAAVTQSAFPPDAEVQSILNEVVQSGRAVGIVVGLLEPGGKRRFLAAGSSGSPGEPLNRHSLFEIGSITKVFTSALLADMARRGEVELQDPVAGLLPPGSRVPARSGKAITLLDLATHHSGLPRLPTNLNSRDPSNPFADYTVPELYDFLASYQLPRDPGAGYEYSNLATGLLGHALAVQAGVPYEQLLVRRILQPLRMDRTRITLAPDLRAHLVQGHDRFGVPVRTWDLPTLAGAGALRSTAWDLIAFAAANLSTQPGAPYDALRDALIARRRVTRKNLPNPVDSIGLNWLFSRRADRVITWHNGGTGGYRSFLGLDLVGRRAAVVLTNNGGWGCDDVGVHLLDPSVPLRPPVALAVVETYRSGGIAAAIERYRDLKMRDTVRWQFDESQLNEVGYWLLERDRAADAVVIFRLNVEAYPEGGNPYDSLGEGLLALGDTAAAIQSYQRSVELDPGNARGIETLRRLRSTQ